MFLWFGSFDLVCDSPDCSQLGFFISDNVVYLQFTKTQIMSKPTLQDKLNYANRTVAELMKEVETLKKDRDNIERNFNNVNECYEGVYDNYEKLKSDYTEVNKDYKDLLDKFTEISAENVALKAEIERTNRHINLAENQLNREQSVEKQPLVVNHYHNCVINK